MRVLWTDEKNVCVYRVELERSMQVSLFIAFFLGSCLSLAFILILYLNDQFLVPCLLLEIKRGRGKTKKKEKKNFSPCL